MLSLTRSGSLFDLLDVQNQFGDLLNQLSERRAFSPVYPRINTWSKGNDIVLTAEVPGVDPKSIDVSVQNSKLTFSGTIATHEKKENEYYIRGERRCGSFRRELELPFRIDSAKVDAKYKNGILTLTIPRAEEDKIKKIAVTIA